MLSDDEHLLAVNESLVMLNQHQYKSLVIACRPTSPDVNVTLKKDEQPVSFLSYFDFFCCIFNCFHQFILQRY